MFIGALCHAAPKSEDWPCCCCTVQLLSLAAGPWMNLIGLADFSQEFRGFSLLLVDLAKLRRRLSISINYNICSVSYCILGEICMFSCMLCEIFISLACCAKSKYIIPGMLCEIYLYLFSLECCAKYKNFLACCGKSMYSLACCAKYSWSVHLAELG